VDAGAIDNDVDLDAAVESLANSFRAALNEPERATAALDARTLRGRFEEPLPQEGKPPADVLNELVTKCDGGLAGGTGGRYFGYVTGGAVPAAAVVEAWTAAVDQNVGMWPLGPAAVELEQVTLEWLAELLEYPRGSGYFTSGATMANTIGLALARQAFGERHDIDVREAGVRALPEFSVYGSEELHLSDYKALRTLGLGSACVRSIPIDERYAMRVDLLERAVTEDRRRGTAPAVVIAQAGSVNTGASDPIEEVAALCEREAIWLHVDGAFGAFFRLCARTRPLAAGIERADSIAVDAHKWLNVPNGTGFVLTRHADLHRRTFSGTAAYLTPDEGMNLHELGIEASRSWRGACVWAALKGLGRDGIAEMVNRCCDLTAELAAAVDAAPELELTAPAPSCVCCFRYRPRNWDDGPAVDEINRRIQRELAHDGNVFLTGAQLPAGFSLRAAIVSWRTQREDVMALVESVRRFGERLSRLNDADVARVALSGRQPG
jgi:glutamate/tyrosine decarboxylase-like PLP-dependent enzyme